MEKRTFRTARAAALGSLLLTQGPLMPLAHAAPAAAGGGVFAAFIGAFWKDAWLTEFIPGRSGLLLQERIPGVFAVEVTDGKGVVAQGAWYEFLRLEEPQLGGVPDPSAATGPLVIEQAVTAGFVVGSRGYVRPAWGLDVTVAAESPAGRVVVESFLPFGIAADLDGAKAGASSLHAALGGAQTVQAGDEEPPLTEDPCRCQEKYENDEDACMWEAASCVSTCFGVAAGALAGCVLTGPFYGICAAGVIAAYLACAAACLADQQACVARAANRLIDCQEECQSREDSPDPGSTKP